MSIFDFLIMVLIAGLLGVVVARILGLQRAGLLLTTIFGFLGVLLARFLVYKLDFPEPIDIYVRSAGIRVPLLWSIIGGVVVAIAAAFLTRKWRKGDRKKK